MYISTYASINISILDRIFFCILQAEKSSIFLHLLFLPLHCGWRNKERGKKFIIHTTTYTLTLSIHLSCQKNIFYSYCEDMDIFCIYIDDLSIFFRFQYVMKTFSYAQQWQYVWVKFITYLFEWFGFPCVWKALAMK